MKDHKLKVARCALADLIGAYQAYKQGDLHAHDWDAHLMTIEELAQEFELTDEIPADLTENGSA